MMALKPTWVTKWLRAPSGVAYFGQVMVRAKPVNDSFLMITKIASVHCTQVLFVKFHGENAKKCYALLCRTLLTRNNSASLIVEQDYLMFVGR